MRVLHLFSNFKWTGPADPAVSLVARLRELGADVVFRTSAYTKRHGIHHVVPRARALGIEPVLDLALGKHRSPLRDRGDVARLRGILRDESYDVVHTHLPNDFRIAVRARGERVLPIVRTLYETDPAALDASEVRSLASEAEAVFAFTERVVDPLVESGVPRDRVRRIDPVVDLARFDPDRTLPDVRARLGVPDDAFLVGLVARVQPQRRFDLVLDLAERLVREEPDLRVVVIGRGSKLDRVARAPARRRGLLDRAILFPGYFEGDDYVAALRMLDVKLFLVPGTDGTARAVREALACGTPVVATRRGLLPELVRHGETGRIVDETVEGLASAILELRRDPAERRRTAERAREDARRRFDPARQARTVLEAYRSVVATA